PDTGLGVRGGVQRGQLPGRAGFGMQVGESGGFGGEQGDLVGAYVVGVTGELADCVVGDDDVGAEVPDVGDETADGLIEGSVDKPGSAGCGLGVPGVVVAEQAWGAGAQDGEGVGEFGRSAAVGGPGGGDDRCAGTGGVVLREHTAG